MNFKNLLLLHIFRFAQEFDSILSSNVLYNFFSNLFCFVSDFYSTKQFCFVSIYFNYASPYPSIKLPNVTTELSREISPKMILLSFSNLGLSCDKRNFSENHFPCLVSFSLVTLSSIFVYEAYFLPEAHFRQFYFRCRALEPNTLAFIFRTAYSHTLQRLIFVVKNFLLFFQEFVI